MDAILLDTDVFSFLMKETDTRAALYKPHVKGKTIALSFVTVGELFAWSVKKGCLPTAARSLREIRTVVEGGARANRCRHSQSPLHRFTRRALQ
jgi:predicted nucleic acid-binding protein